MNDSRIINGSFGECFHDGKWMTNVYKMTAEIELSYGEVKLSGSRWLGQKLLSLKGTGSISGYKVTSELAQAVAVMTDDRRGEFRTELISKLNDPESFGCERVRLKNVKFTKIPVVGWEVNSMIEEEWPFTFTGIEYLDPITES